MKENYKAWNINIDGFPKEGSIVEQLKFLINFAILAPSSHNSQPWAFTVSEQGITILPEEGRALRESDNNKRQQFISMGCALENIIIAADYFGYTGAITYHLDGVSNARIDVRFSKQQKTGDLRRDPEHLATCITKRRTNRGNYDMSKMLEGKVVQAIRNFSTSQISVFITGDTEIKRRVTETILVATDDAMRSADFRQELAKYITPSITSSPIGMPGNTIGAPFLFSFILSTLIRKMPPGAAQRNQLRTLLEKTPFFLLIATPGDTREEWIKTGQVYQRIALLAEQNRLATHPLAAAIQIGNHYIDLAKIFDTNLRPQFFCRIGYPTKEVPHSPRLTSGKVTLAIP
ncbi:MAG: nitroreductase family protein [bacterium]|nr:nitroreductase family protein [bacterium]